LAAERRYNLSELQRSRHDGQAKQAIAAFVEAVTKEGGADFVAPADRIATFDQDGTLWVEHPLYTQAVLALERMGWREPRDGSDVAFRGCAPHFGERRAVSGSIMASPRLLGLSRAPNPHAGSGGGFGLSRSIRGA
jgi:hypothetical protein